MDFTISSFPLEPRSQQLTWSSTRDMLCEILIDLGHDSVQNFLLRTSPIFDVNFLASPSCMTRGLSTTSSYRTADALTASVSGSDLLSVRALLPTHTSDNYFFALGVCSSDPSEEKLQFFPSNDHCFHYALNLQTRRIIGLSVDETKQQAVLHYLSPTSSNPFNLILHFDSRVFTQSFKHDINVDKLTDALRTSFVSCIDNKIEFPKFLPDFTGSVLTGEQFPTFCRGYIARSFAMRCVHSVFQRGAVTKGNQFLILCNQNCGTHHGTVESMRQWAIRVKLSSVPPVPKIMPSSNTSSEKNVAEKSITLGNGETYISEQVKNVSVRKATKIAPAPYDTSSTHQLSYAELMDAKDGGKIKIRKIKNRISAAKSNKRRRAQRQLNKVTSFRQ